MSAETETIGEGVVDSPLPRQIKGKVDSIIKSFVYIVGLMVDGGRHCLVLYSQHRSKCFECPCGSHHVTGDRLG